MNKIDETLSRSIPVPEYLMQAADCDLGDILFFDIETTGLSPKNSDIYLIGAAYFKEDLWHICQFFAENTCEQEDVLKAFSDLMGSYKALVSFNGDRFDIPFLRSKYNALGLEEPFGQKKSFDLYKFVHAYKIPLGLPDCKQKTVELLLGINREDKYSGGDLIRVYKEFLVSKDEDFKELLLLHNSDDVKGMLCLLPILNFGSFFSSFGNMPRVSVRTDEDIEEKDLGLPVRAVKVSANYYNSLDGSSKQEVIMKLALNTELPAPLSANKLGCFFKAEKKEAVLRVPLFEEELKYFYSNYKDYYYLPHEDMAIHKSLGEFVDKNFRQKAKAENCYTKKKGQYLIEWDLVFTPFFKRDYKDKNFFFELNDTMKKSRLAMSLYASHVIANVLDL
ncbi:MAG: ribonuclease H-like domain-containing protein [Butyrivibrio sp.]|nr:ribonuclease H-like domain-containing protein [Butyrivibrio sp.]